MTSKKPHLLNLHILEELGYSPTGEGIANEAKQICILELERTDDGSIGDFVYCSHLVKDSGFIDERPLSFFMSRVPIRTADGEVHYPAA